MSSTIWRHITKFVSSLFLILSLCKSFLEAGRQWLIPFSPSGGWPSMLWWFLSCIWRKRNGFAEECRLFFLLLLLLLLLAFSKLEQWPFWLKLEPAETSRKLLISMIMFSIWICAVLATAHGNECVHDTPEDVPQFLQKSLQLQEDTRMSTENSKMKVRAKRKEGEIQTYHFYANFHGLDPALVTLMNIMHDSSVVCGSCGIFLFSCEEEGLTDAECSLRDMSTCLTSPVSCSADNGLRVLRTGIIGQNFSSVNTTDFTSLKNLWADRRRHELLASSMLTQSWLPATWGPTQRVLITTILMDPVERLRSVFYISNEDHSPGGFYGISGSPAWAGQLDTWHRDATWKGLLWVQLLSWWWWCKNCEASFGESVWLCRHFRDDVGNPGLPCTALWQKTCRHGNFGTWRRARRTKDWKMEERWFGDGHCDHSQGPGDLWLCQRTLWKAICEHVEQQGRVKGTDQEPWRSLEQEMGTWVRFCVCRSWATCRDSCGWWQWTVPTGYLCSWSAFGLSILSWSAVRLPSANWSLKCSNQYMFDSGMKKAAPRFTLNWQGLLWRGLCHQDIIIKTLVGWVM